MLCIGSVTDASAFSQAMGFGALHGVQHVGYVRAETHAVEMHGNQSCAEVFFAEAHAGDLHGNPPCAADFCAESHAVDLYGNRSCAEERGCASADVQAPPAGEFEDARAQCSDVTGFRATPARLASPVSVKYHGCRPEAGGQCRAAAVSVKYHGCNSSGYIGLTVRIVLFAFYVFALYTFKAQLAHIPIPGRRKYDHAMQSLTNALLVRRLSLQPSRAPQTFWDGIGRSCPAAGSAQTRQLRNQHELAVMVDIAIRSPFAAPHVDR